MVARGGPIRKANQDGEAARRVRIDLSRFESIEAPTRGFSVRVSALLVRHPATWPVANCYESAFFIGALVVEIFLTPLHSRDNAERG